jgi:hypothetical protein
MHANFDPPTLICARQSCREPRMRPFSSLVPLEVSQHEGRPLLHRQLVESVENARLPFRQKE